MYVQEIFNIIEYDTGKTFKFHHIDGEGLSCILADEHQGQALGLGEFLHNRDPTKSVENHLKCILKTCIVHFN
ncbi:14306_t:CDS:2, partial [Entrophospora sp. SA101]